MDVCEIPTVCIIISITSFSELLVQRGLGLAMTDDQLDVVPGRDQE